MNNKDRIDKPVSKKKVGFGHGVFGKPLDDGKGQPFGKPVDEPKEKEQQQAPSRARGS